MAVLVIALICGVVVGVATGGRVRNLGRLRYRAWPVLIAAAGTQVLLGDLPGPGRWGLAVIDCGAVVAWSWLNRTSGRWMSGLDLFGLGVVLNALVMAANRGMPVSRAGLASAGLSPKMDVARGHLYKHVIMTAHTRIRFLGDVIPLAPLRTVMSAGDVLMLAGIVITIGVGTHADTDVPLAA